MHNRKGTTIVTQQEKVTNETRQQMNNLFQRLCSVRSFCCRESLLSYFFTATGSFHFEPSQLLLDTFSKSSTLPWKNRQQNASWSFSWSCSPATIDFQKSPSSDFYMARDLSRICRSLGRFVQLDFAVVSMGFSEALSSFSHFSCL